MSDETNSPTPTPTPLPTMDEMLERRIDWFLRGLPASLSAFETAERAPDADEQDEEVEEDEYDEGDEEDDTLNAAEPTELGADDDYTEEPTLPDCAPAARSCPASQILAQYETSFINQINPLTITCRGSILSMAHEAVGSAEGGAPPNEGLPQEAYDWTRGPKRPRFYTDDEALHWEEHGVKFNFVEYLLARRRQKIREDPDYPDPFTMSRGKSREPSPDVAWPFSSDEENANVKDKSKGKEKAREETPEKATAMDDWYVTPPNKWSDVLELPALPGSNSSGWIPPCGQPGPPPLTDRRQAVYRELELPVREVRTRSSTSFLPVMPLTYRAQFKLPTNQEEHNAMLLECAKTVDYLAHRHIQTVAKLNELYEDHYRLDERYCMAYEVMDMLQGGERSRNHVFSLLPNQREYSMEETCGKALAAVFRAENPDKAERGAPAVHRGSPAAAAGNRAAAKKKRPAPAAAPAAGRGRGKRARK